MKTSRAPRKPKILADRSDAPPTAKLQDISQTALRELFFVEHPHLKGENAESKKALEEFINKNRNNDCWIYYPWHHTVVHLVNEELYFRLRTARNRNIITEEEQNQYRRSTIAVAGLSIGSAILSALVISGGPKKIKLADFDAVALSNLNRIKATLLDVGSNKTHVAVRMVWELDPFAEIETWDKGVNQKNLKDFLVRKQKVDIFIDEMDDLSLKVKARTLCRQEGIPVIMATDNGDSVLVDVERFDLEPKRPFFHNAIPNIENRSLDNLDYRGWISLATKIVDPRYLPEKMQSSIAEIGKSIAAVPQLGITASIAGAAVSYVVRRVANKQDMPSGRYVINLEEVFNPPSPEQ